MNSCLKFQTDFHMKLDESEENQVYENSLFYILEQEETHE